MLTELTAAIRRTVVPHGPALEGRARLTGAWRVTSVDTEFQSSGKREPAFGPDPKGFFVFTADGRAIALIAAKERQPGNSLEQLAALCRTMLAYAGPFRVERDKLIIDVDISSNQAWTGGAQERFNTIAGDAMEMVTAWMPSPFHADRPMVRGVLNLKRAHRVVRTRNAAQPSVAADPLRRAAEPRRYAARIHDLPSANAR